MFWKELSDKLAKVLGIRVSINHSPGMCACSPGLDWVHFKDNWGHGVAVTIDSTSRRITNVLLLDNHKTVQSWNTDLSPEQVDAIAAYENKIDAR